MGFSHLSPFNPPLQQYSENFAILGDSVRLRDKDEKIFSGTSITTTYAAAIAAAVLHVSRQLPIELFCDRHDFLSHTVTFSLRSIED